MPAPHHKGRSSPKAKEHRFPYHVDMLVPEGGFGAGLNTIHAWLEARGVPAVTGRGRHTDSGDYIRWCFADPDVAVEFANIFDGLIGRRRR